MRYSNPHTHTTFCDGRDSVEHIARRAKEMGFVSLGISSHGPQTNNTFGFQDEKSYAEEVRRVASLMAPDMKVWLGVEQDYYGFCNIDYDYRVGGVHYIEGTDGAVYSVDHTEELFSAMLENGFHGSPTAMAKSYYGRVLDMCRKNRPNIVAHFDLICKYNEGNAFFDERDPAYLAIALDALEALSHEDILLEINTGAIARGRRTRPYPDMPLLRRWHELGGRVIFGSACHDAEKLLCGWETAMEMLKSAGFRTAWRLGERSELFIEEAIEE